MRSDAKISRIFLILIWIYLATIAITLAAGATVPEKSSFVGDKGCYSYEVSITCIGFVGAGVIQTALNFAIWGTFGSFFLVYLAYKAKPVELQHYFYAVIFWIPILYLIYRILPRAFIRIVLVLCACGAIAITTLSGFNALNDQNWGAGVVALGVAATLAILSVLFL
jgi:hypothetical protein